MKRYFIYAIVLGLVGNTLLGNATQTTNANSVESKLIALGE